MRRELHPLLRAALSPGGWLYGWAVRLRNRHYDRPQAVQTAALPVISVGNITVGGTGKTPIVGWLAARLRQRPRRPAVVSRGYRGTAGAGPLVVSRGEGLQCPAAACGDEAAQLARTLPGVIVVVGADRAAGVEAARAEGADVALLDDGFQHRRLARDLDLVLVDCTDPFGGGRLLPAGRLREPPGSLLRADVVILTRSDGPGVDDVERRVRRHAPGVEIHRATHRPSGYVDTTGRPVPGPPRALAFCGIGNPDRFYADLEADGVELVERRTFRDHHPFAAGELAGLRRRAAELDAAPVTTEKDLTRIGPLPAEDRAADLLALRIEVVIEDEPRLLDRIFAVLEQRR